MPNPWVIFLTIYAIQFVQLTDFMSIAPLGALLIKNQFISENLLAISLSAYSIAAIAASFLTVKIKIGSIYNKTIFLLGVLLASQLLLVFECNDTTFIISKILGGLSGGLLGAFSYSQLGLIDQGKNIGVWNGRIQTAQSVITLAAIPFALTLSSQAGPKAFFIGMSFLIALVIFSYMINFKTIGQLGVPAAKNSDISKNVFPWDVVITGFLCYFSAFLFITYLPNFLLNQKMVSLSRLNLAYAVSGVITLLVASRLGSFGDKVNPEVLLIGALALLSSIQLLFLFENMHLWIVVLLPAYLVLSTSRMIYQRGIILKKNQSDSVRLHLWNNVAIRLGIMCSGICLASFQMGFSSANKVAIMVNVVTLFSLVFSNFILQKPSRTN